MITFGDVVKAFRTGEMTDELANLDMTVAMGILSGKPYRRVSVYETASSKLDRIDKSAKRYADDGEHAPAATKAYMACDSATQDGIKRAVNKLSCKLRDTYGGVPTHASATKIVLCDEAAEGEQDFLLEDIIASLQK